MGYKFYEARATEVPMPEVRTSIGRKRKMCFAFVTHG